MHANIILVKFADFKSIWTEGVRSLFPGEEEVQGGLITVFHYLKSTKSMKSLHKEQHGGDKRQRVQIALNIIKSFYRVRTIRNCHNPPRVVVESSLL